jgi:CheY-like chemotaxis protein/anti-sigma regulatory factor (Ser/Thr protein kinase)
MALDLKPASLGALAQSVVKVLERQADAKNITLRLKVEDGLPDVPLDNHRMTQVITNLLNNAIKYTPPGGGIAVKIGEALGNPDLIEVSVSDTGCGIPEKEHERIFDRLYQVHAGDATTEQGVGLGLYLCKEFVQLHGGSIRVESEPRQGSTFSFVLPKSQQFLRANLLIIDDDPEMLELLSTLLTSEQYNVRTARDGAEGLEQMRRQSPDMVVLDLAMPKLNGPDTLKEIRQHWGAVPIIIHTGFAHGDLMKQALEYSPFTLLAKPSTTEQVLETIRKLHRSEDTTLWKRNHYDLPKPHYQ